MIHVSATPEGKRKATCMDEWSGLKVIELSILGISTLCPSYGVDSVTLFARVKEARNNPFLSDVVIAKVVERMHYQGLIQITQA